MSSPKTLAPIQSLWVGRDLSQLEVLSIRSYLHHGHPFHLYVYEDIQNIPAGVTILDAEEIIARANIPYRFEDMNLPLFGNWFRWEMLHKKGGIYSDLDCICLKPLPKDKKAFIGTEIHDWNPEQDKPPTFFVLSIREKEDSQYITEYCSNGLMKFPPGHPLLSLMVERCRHPFRLFHYHSWKMRRRCLKITGQYFLKTGRFPFHENSGPVIRKLGCGVIGGPKGLSEEVKKHGWQELADRDIFHAYYTAREKLYSCPDYAQSILDQDRYHAVHIYKCPELGALNNHPLPESCYARLLKQYNID